MTREEIIESLKPMFVTARKENLWFHTVYQDLWFTPDQLEKHHKEGKFVWGEKNWQLKKPTEKIKSIEKEIEQLQNFKRNLIAS